MKSYVILSKDQLLRAGQLQPISPLEHTRLTRRLQALSDAKFPVIQHFLHNDTEVRFTVVLNEAGEELILTVPLIVFMKYSQASVPESQAEAQNEATS